MKKFAPQLSLFGALCLGVLDGAPAAQAGVIIANGVTWELTSAAQPGVDKTGLFTLSATMSPGWEGGSTAWLGSFMLKNFGSAVQIDGGITSSAGGLWDWTNRELTASGCNTNAAHEDALCVYLTDVVPGPGNVVESELGGSTPNTLGNFSFSFTVSAVDFLPELLHMKVNWWEEDCKTKQGVTTCTGWKKVEDLISQDVSYYTPPGGDPGGDPNQVPLPGTLALLGIGLLGLGATRKRVV